MGLFDMIYRCPYCGKPCLSPKEAAKHCDSYTHADWGLSGRICPDCKGSGKSYDFFGSEKACPRCDGRGEI